MSQHSPLPRLPNYLLGAMTLVSFGGPLAMYLVIRGGLRAEWPPDRPVEWIVFGLVIGLAVALFVACLTVGWWYTRSRQAKPADSPGSDPRTQSTNR